MGKVAFDAALVARLESEPPARELDCLIHEAIHDFAKPEMRGKYYGEFSGEYFYPDGEVSRCLEYTTDVGAAVTFALSQGVEEYEIQLIRGRGYGRVQCNIGGFVPSAKGYAAHPAQALCAAVITLQAEIAKL